MKFTLFGTMHAGVFIDVEADSYAEALEIAQAADTPRLCHQCCRQDKRGWGLSDGLGDLVDIEPEEEALIDGKGQS